MVNISFKDWTWKYFGKLMLLVYQFKKLCFLYIWGEADLKILCNGHKKCPTYDYNKKKNPKPQK